MTKKSDLPNIAKSVLKRLLKKSGEVIYSSHETLKKGDIYLMGLNPGGEGFISIEAHIDRMLERTSNSYLDEAWTNGNANWGVGQAPLQKRVTWLLEQLVKNPRDVCASNLIFETSQNADQISFGLAGLCWSFHESVIDIVQPRLIIAFGNGKQSSPYSFLKAIFEGEEQSFDAGHGKMLCKGFETNIDNRRTYIAGLPHLSRYDPRRNPAVITWLKRVL